MKKFIIAVAIILVGGSLWLIVSDDIQFTDERQDEVPEGENSDQESVSAIEWSGSEITSQGGDVLVRSDDLPTSVEVSEESSFGVGGEISGAVLSPDRERIAFATHGAVHDAGWLYDLTTDTVDPVVFSYGGGVGTIEWSPEGQFMAFSVSSPADISLIHVVNKDEIEQYVSETGFTVEVQGEEELDPPYRYEFTEWQSEDTLCFTFEGDASCINVETGEIE